MMRILFYTYNIYMEKMGFYVKRKMHYVDIVRTNNKNIYLKVKEDKIIANVPYGVPESIIRDFINQHIEKFVDHIQNTKIIKLFSIKNKFIHLLGKKYSFTSLTGFKESSVYIKGNNAYINTTGGTDDEIKEAVREHLKNDLTNYLSKVIPKFEKIMQSPEHKFRVVFKTSTWGTNNVGKYRLSFSSRLAHYNREIVDYVVVHELAHTFQGNHQKEFWDIVEKYCPDYKNLRQQLKADQALSE